jgi:hypothetical protein
MEQEKQAQSVSIRGRILVLAGEILFGIGLVILTLLYAVHKNDPWMPRSFVLNAGFWLVFGLAAVGLSIRMKRLQRKLMERDGVRFSVFDSWLVWLTSGIAAVVYAASRLNDVFGRGTTPSGIGRTALLVFYALSATTSLALATNLLRWSLNREEQTIDVANSEALSFKDRLLTVLSGAFLAFQGIRMLMAAWTILRA